MYSIICILVFLASIHTTVHGLRCATNPCELGEYFQREKGYTCLELSADVVCTCPNNQYELNRPCRVCNRTNPLQNACLNSSSLIACLETDDFGTSYACLCATSTGTELTTSPTCGGSSVLVPISTTTPRPSNTNTPSTIPQCLNGGNFVDDACQCPSGYYGYICENKNDFDLCNRILCKNQGACAIRNTNGPYESVCFCRFGTSGEFCELNGTLGFCSPNFCKNNAPCRENVLGSNRHAYCHCLPGFNGPKCENQYFQCKSEGNFPDEYLKDQGKYFQCKNRNGLYQLEHKSCAKGLRFNSRKNTCTFP